MDQLLCRTAGCTLRACAQGDLAPLYAIATRLEVARMLFVFRPDMSPAAFARHFPLGTLTPPFRAVVERDGQVVGSIGVGAGAVPSIYYFLAPGAAGQGLGTQMVAGFAAELQRRHGLHSLSAEVFHDNPASRRVLERNGFRVIGERLRESAARDAPALALILQRG